MVLGQGGEDRSSSRSKPVRPFLGNLGGEVRMIWRPEGRHAGAWKVLSVWGGSMGTRKAQGQASLSCHASHGKAGIHHLPLPEGLFGGGHSGVRGVTEPTGPNPPSSGQPDKGVRVGGRGKEGKAGRAPALPVTSQWQTPHHDGCHLALCRLSAPLRWGRPFVPKCRHTSASVSRTYYLGRKGDRCPVLTSTSEPFNPHSRP